MSLLLTLPPAVLKQVEHKLQECEDLLACRRSQQYLLVSIPEQRLYLLDDFNQVVTSYPVSTATKGAGNKEGSFQTPIGLHCIVEKIGHGCPEGELFKAREPQGECAVIESQAISTQIDCITSRILWLDGLEDGINRNGHVDSKARYIYIHGTHEEGLIGQPASIGCVRMKNRDVIDLFDRVDEGDWVYIFA